MDMQYTMAYEQIDRGGSQIAAIVGLLLHHLSASYMTRAYAKCTSMPTEVEDV
jgi:hypothetical protein